MRARGLTLLLLLTLTLGALRFPSAPDSERKTGIKVAAVGDFPHQVAIVQQEDEDEDEDEDDGTPSCGGSLIGPRHVLTAAHCLTDEDGVLEDVWLRSGEILAGTTDALSIGAPRRRIVHIWMHELFDREDLRRDLAMIELDRALPTNAAVRPATLASAPPAPGTWCNVSGWGISDAVQVEDAWNLRYISVPVVPLEWCERFYDADVSTSVCAGGCGYATCKGDSGSPLTCAGQLVGLLSGGDDCSNGYPFADWYVDLTQFGPWIEEKLRESDHQEL